MAWRVHLTNQAIQQLHILPGKSPILAAWTRLNRVHYYEFLTGTSLGEKQIPNAPDQPHRSHAWQEFAGSLTGPDTNMYLPMVRTNQGDIYLTDDGQMRIYG